MHILLDKYGIGKNIILTDWQVKRLNSVELGDYNELIDLDLIGDDTLHNDLEINGLSYSLYHKSKIAINVRDIEIGSRGLEATIQSLSIYLLIVDITKVIELIHNFFNIKLTNEGSIINKGGIEIRIQLIQTINDSFLSIFQTNNPKVINPRYWICESYSKKPFEKLNDPSFYLLYKALKYSINEVLKRSVVGRYDLSIEDVEEIILESGDIEVYVYNQMEDSKITRKFNLIIKKV